MKTPLALAALTVMASATAAAPQPFTASYTGSSDVIELVNPTGPVLRFATVASGSGSFHLLSYTSTDVIDMSTGVGSGSNRFRAANGDELYGTFSVQVIPTAEAHIVGLSGLATFSGGTGIFNGASGSATLIGTGVFSSDTHAEASLQYSGSIALVPEPGSAAMLLTGLAAALPLLRRRLQAARLTTA